MHDPSEVTALGEAQDTASDGQRKVFAAMAKYAGDPFHGSVKRHVLPAHMQPTDMEVLASESALRAAGMEPGDIDFILQESMVPDDQLVNTACRVHERLGLAERFLTMPTGATCNALAMQMDLADGLIATGRYRYGLLIQSSTISRLIRREARYSPWFGDGATAVVVGPVSSGRGLLAITHRTDGSFVDGMVASVRGRQWYEDGRIWWHPRGRAAARTMLTSVADQAQHAVLERRSV